MSGIEVFSAVRLHCETASLGSAGCYESYRVKESLPNYEFDIDSGGTFDNIITPLLTKSRLLLRNGPKPGSC